MSELVDIIKDNKFFQKNQAQLYEFYLSGTITEAEDYIDWFDCIRNARASDTIRIYINSNGGDIHTALQFLRVLADTEATVVCSIEGACMSAATMIFLAADEHEITPHSLFMIHTYSSGMFGKGGELYEQVQFEYRWSRAFLRDIYADFLKEEEIEQILQNKDIWLDYTEVISRLQSFYKAREHLLSAKSNAEDD